MDEEARDMCRGEGGGSGGGLVDKEAHSDMCGGKGGGGGGGSISSKLTLSKILNPSSICVNFTKPLTFAL